jgi:hypothetical protein
VKLTSSDAKLRAAAPLRRKLPPAYTPVPSARRSLNAVNALPSARFMPIQSQPAACGGRKASLHS